MKKVTLAQDAYLEYDGNCTWYQALAEDEDGNEYIVRWDIREDYDPEMQDEESACDWESPFEICDDRGHDVTDSVTLA